MKESKKLMKVKVKCFNGFLGYVYINQTIWKNNSTGEFNYITEYTFNENSINTKIFLRNYVIKTFTDILVTKIHTVKTKENIN